MISMGDYNNIEKGNMPPTAPLSPTKEGFGLMFCAMSCSKRHCSQSVNAFAVAFVQIQASLVPQAY